MKLLAELDTGKGVGLIERVRQGLCQTLYHPRRPYPTAGAFPQTAAFQRPRLRRSRGQDCGKTAVKSAGKSQSRLRKSRTKLY